MELSCVDALISAPARFPHFQSGSGTIRLRKVKDFVLHSIDRCLPHFDVICITSCFSEKPCPGLKRSDE
ncbi:MAG: hypothetical protein JWM43_4073 [Acidobacteriaceae bacterium]|nr:hypothetical protein [Acidobacteriaceae bacterium]